MSMTSQNPYVDLMTFNMVALGEQVVRRHFMRDWYLMKGTTDFPLTFFLLVSST